MVNYLEWKSSRPSVERPCIYKKIKDLNSAAKVDEEQKLKNKNIVNKNIPFLLWPCLTLRALSKVE